MRIGPELAILVGLPAIVLTIGIVNGERDTPEPDTVPTSGRNNTSSNPDPTGSRTAAGWC